MTDTIITLVNDSSSDTELLIYLQEVKFSWTKKILPVVDIASLSLKRGEHLFVRGHSGSGKTTLLNLLAGVLTPTSGSISVLGQALEKLRAAERDRFRGAHIGVIFQQFNLLPYLSILENVTLPCRFSSERACKASNQAGSVVAEAKQLLRRLGLNIDELAACPVAELSVGQQQRVAAARALIGVPDLILADEPTSALDADNRAAFLDLLFAELERVNAGLVFVSHDVSLQERFDKVLDLQTRQIIQRDMPCDY